MSKAARNAAIQMSSLLLLFSVAATSQADHDPNAEEQHILTAPARMILDHNKWLLVGSTIGSALSKSSNSKAKGLYNEAHRLYTKAETSYESGEENLARDLSQQSMKALYESDKHHYALPDK